MSRTTFDTGNPLAESIFTSLVTVSTTRPLAQSVLVGRGQGRMGAIDLDLRSLPYARCKNVIRLGLPAVNAESDARDEFRH